ncbi:MAG TPA: hypothetical protein VHH34_25210, partial [Pseudonocardiaceae bacterium]|nr:hypothetical protein [Pseudonocardiaceae bacterium]
MNSRMITVVDGYSTGAWLADRLRRHDVSAVHVRSTPDPGAHFAHSFRPQDYEDELAATMDAGPIVTALRRRRVERVVAGTESGVELADRLNEALGTPGNDPMLSAARRDKAVMLRAARAAGVRVPHSRTVSSAAEAVRWASRSGAAAWVA